MDGAFLFTRTPRVLIHYTEFHIAGEMLEPFAALYSKENQISNLPIKNEAGFVKSVGRMFQERKWSL